MLIERIWTNNAFRNYNYVIACPQTGEAMAIDPLDVTGCLDKANSRGWTITQILNTHEHGDHIGGNPAMVEATGARILAHADAGDRIPGMDVGLHAGDQVKVGHSVTLRVLDTPGHTRSHVCLLQEGDRPALFCGDTLFNAGAGNCHNGGHPELLFETFQDQIAQLPDDTRVFPGHDYLANNLGFTLDREPGNHTAQQLLTEAKTHDPDTAKPTTLGLEREINTFLRLGNREVIEGLRQKFPKLPKDPSAKEVFLHLRQLRNDW